MEETKKISKSYSLDPKVIAWIMQKAARLTIEGDGERASDSKVVNDYLTAAMEEDIRNEAQKKSSLRMSASSKVKRAEPA